MFKKDHQSTLLAVALPNPIFSLKPPARMSVLSYRTHPAYPSHTPERDDSILEVPRQFHSDFRLPSKRVLFPPGSIRKGPEHLCLRLKPAPDTSPFAVLKQDHVLKKTKPGTRKHFDVL